MVNREQYRQRGFVLLKDVLDAGVLDTIRDEAKQIFLIQLKRKGLIRSLELSEAEFEAGLYELFRRDFQQVLYCGKQAQHLISLHRLSLEERILKVLRELGLEFPLINVRPTVFFNSPHLGRREVDWKKPAHQDWRTTQGSLDSAVVWVPLVRIDKALGALEVVPESHRMGLLSYESHSDYLTIAEDQSRPFQFVSIEADKGDALVFSTLLVHRSGENTSGSIRWSCHFRYNNLHEPTFVERGFPHSYIYKPQDELISPGFPSAADVEAVFGQDL